MSCPRLSAAALSSQRSPGVLAWAVVGGTACDDVAFPRIACDLDGVRRSDLDSEQRWQPGARTLYLPETRAAIVGLGGIGTETAKRCADFSMDVVAVDARITEPPVCVPTASGTIPSATAAAEPEEEPPGVCAGPCGLRVLPACM